MTHICVKSPYPTPKTQHSGHLETDPICVAWVYRRDTSQQPLGAPWGEGVGGWPGETAAWC